MDYRRSDRLSDLTDDRVVFYIEDLSSDASPNKSLKNFQRDIKETQGLYPHDTQRFHSRSSSVYSQSGRSKNSRTIAGADGHGGAGGGEGSRRASVHGTRSRESNCNGQTPLGDGRRASVCRKGRPKRGSTVRRKDSVQPGRATVPLNENVDKVLIPPAENVREIRQDRNRRKIVMIILGIFIFLLVASVLVVVITLTHSSFHRFQPHEATNDSETSSP